MRIMSMPFFVRPSRPSIRRAVPTTRRPFASVLWRPTKRIRTSVRLAQV
jgi:hypothetical protein